MSDNISRQNALDALVRRHEELAVHRCYALANGVGESIEVIKELPSTDEWIPCSERLPEDVEIGEEYPTVIFCTKDAVYVGFYEYYRGGRWWAAEDYTVDDVIAWMPLPKPYKGGAV